MSTRPSIIGFRHANGQWVDIVDPDALATWRQLFRLNAAGMLEIVAPGATKPISKGEAAAAINRGKA
jgi:hypothetical protein